MTYSPEDEQLAAYLDGEMSAEQRAALETHLANDPAAAQRLDKMRRADSILRARVAEIAEEMPALREKIIPFVRASKAARVQGWRAQAIAALAAGLAGFVVGTSGYLSDHHLNAKSNEAPIARGALETALDTVRSGPALAADETGQRIVLSFRSNDGRFCRQFETVESTFSAEGVACLDGGDWRILSFEAMRDDRTGYRVAGRAGRTEAIMDALGAVSAMDADEEADHIARRWRRER